MRNLIDAHADGQLDLVRSMEMDRHLAECADCRAALDAVRRLKASVGADGLYYRAPADLVSRIRAQAVGTAGGTARMKSIPWPRVFSIAALVAIAIGVGAVVQRFAAIDRNPIMAEILACHIRSLQADHLVDVKSTDQHTVKPWFDGKLDFAPPVRDFKSQGFALEGGRLDYAAGRPVAALVYARGKHTINLFIWPSSEGDTEPATSHEQGYTLVGWSQTGMRFWAVSDVSPGDLAEFVNLCRTVSPAAGPSSEPTESR
jgi:anti-sigma factor RsiW